jgi:hypothetical protein
LTGEGRVLVRLVHLFPTTSYLSPGRPAPHLRDGQAPTFYSCFARGDDLARCSREPIQRVLGRFGGWRKGANSRDEKNTRVSRKIAARPPEETALDLIFFALSGGASTLITV